MTATVTAAGAALVAEVDAHEGPVYSRTEDALYVTTVPRPAPRGGVASPRNSILRVQLDGTHFPVDLRAIGTVCADVGAANGMAGCADGSLLVCVQGSPTEPAAITRGDPVTGDHTVIVDSWRGMPLNSPNDVVVAADGAIWFTDPTYGHLQGFRPPSHTGDLVYRHDPATGVTTPVADDLDKPNGLAFSPDGHTLYVADSGANHEPGTYDPARPHHVVAYDVLGGRRLGARRLFAVVVPGFPDGLKVDAAGRVYISTGAGVEIFSVDGDPLGHLDVPGAVNFTFGGPDGDVLFVTTDSAIRAVALGPLQQRGV